MTNELLSYIKDSIYAVLLLLVMLDWIEVGEEVLAQIGVVVLLVGGLIIRINSIRKGGAPQVLKEKAAVAEAEGLVTSSGVPPTTP